MKSTQISFEIPEDLLHALNESREQFVHQVRLFTALQLFKSRKLSFGKAAELAGMNKERFLVELDQHAIALIDYDPSGLEQEIERLNTTST